METIMRWLFAALVLIGGLRAAAADIRIDESRYESGQLIVAGQTAPGKTVTLDDRYKTKSNGEGHFTFKLKYKPATCMSDIRSGDDIYSAVIAGCLDPGFGDDRLPVKKKKKTSARPKS
jgi:hypothetical protein